MDKDIMQEKFKSLLKENMDFFLEKNKNYGNSALKPLEIYGKHVSKDKTQAENMILIRLDDKISRIRNAEELRMNDIVDQIVYLQLLCIEKGWTDWSSLID